MALSTAFAGMALPPERLKTIGASACVVLAVLDFATMAAKGAAVLALRGGAGAAEGLLLWITVGMIARTVTPERWAGVFFTAVTAAQLILALAFAVFVIPRFGAAGGFAVLAFCSLIGVLPALATPSRYASLVIGHKGAGPPSLRGWIALSATLIFAGSGVAVGVYLEPLALEAGLSPDVARTAVWISLAAQVAGGAAATALAGRVGYVNVFAVGAALLLAAWGCIAFHIPAAAFVAAIALGGLVFLFMGPFFVPMMIEADPSRRAAVQSGGAQLLGGALGPLAASQLVSGRDAHGVLVLGATLVCAGLSIVVWLHATRQRAAAPSSRSSSCS